MAAEMNLWLLSGNLTADPVLKDVGDSKVCNFSVATNEGYKDKSTNEWVKKAEFHNCVAWGKVGEFVANYFAKGDPIWLRGSHTTDMAEKEGVKRYFSKMKVVEARFNGGNKRDGSEGGEAPKKGKVDNSVPTQPEGNDSIPF